MKIRPILAIIYRYFSILRASPDRILGLYIWMLIDMVLWGLHQHLSLAPRSADFQRHQRVSRGSTFGQFFLARHAQHQHDFFEDMWSRNFLNIFASPMRISEYLAGLIACGILTSSIGLMLAFGSAGLLFGFSPLAYGPMILPFLAILFLLA